MPEVSPCLVSQVPLKAVDKALTRERTRMIWRYMTDKHLFRVDAEGKPIGFDAAVSATASDLGIPESWVLQAINKPKGPLRRISNELYRKQDARKNAINEAKARIDDLAANGAGNFVRHYLGTAASIPRRVLTFGHGPVFPVTHAGDLMFRPSAMPSYWRNYYRAWRFMSTAAHNRIMERMTTDPDYARARSALLDVDPSRGPSGILIGGSRGWSRRAWDALKVLRFELFKSELKRIQKKNPLLRKSLADTWENLTEEERRATEKDIARSINHATGIMSSDEAGLGVVEKAMFAPKLTESKFMKSVVDPALTIRTGFRIATGQSVPFNERYVAAMRTRNAAQYLATRGSLLALNRTLSGQTVNFDDPLKGDWLRFKVGRYVINDRGSREVISLLGRLVAIEQASYSGYKGSYRLRKTFGTANEKDAVIMALGRYSEYKEAPGISLVTELATGRDVFGRPLPSEVFGVKTPYANLKESPSKPRYEWPELIGEHMPIYMGGATREIYQAFRERGFSAKEATDVIRGLANDPSVIAEGIGSGVFEFLGGGFYKEKENK